MTGDALGKRARTYRPLAVTWQGTVKVTVPPTVTRASDGENDAACTFTVTAGDGGGGGPGGGGGGGAGGGLIPVLSLPPHASMNISNPIVARMVYVSGMS